MFDRMLITPVIYATVNWSSFPEVFCKKGILRNCTRFTGKDLCQSIFFNKVAGLRPATILKKILWHRCFPVNFVKFPKTPFYIEHLWWLLLSKTESTKQSSCPVKIFFRWKHVNPKDKLTRRKWSFLFFSSLIWKA